MEPPPSCSCFIWKGSLQGLPEWKEKVRKQSKGFHCLSPWMACAPLLTFLAKTSHIALPEENGKWYTQSKVVCTGCPTSSPPIPSSVAPMWAGLHHSHHHSLLIPKANGHFHIPQSLSSISAPYSSLLWAPTMPPSLGPSPLSHCSVSFSSPSPPLNVDAFSGQVLVLLFSHSFRCIYMLQLRHGPQHSRLERSLYTFGFSSLLDITQGHCTRDASLLHLGQRVQIRNLGVVHSFFFFFYISFTFIHNYLHSIYIT